MPKTIGVAAGAATRLIAALVVGVSLLAAPHGHAADVPCQAEETISEDTTWTRAESPYVLPCHVFVDPGATLTIEPGVRVETEALFVSGGLRAEGTPAEPIVFTGVDGEAWKGIMLVDVPGLRPPSSIHDVEISGATVGLRLGRDGIPVHDSVFTDNVYGLFVENPGTNLTFTGNELYSNETAFRGRTSGVLGLYANDFWDNDVSLFFQAQRRWDCRRDPGIFDVRFNDILRGPDDRWFSFDVRASSESGHSGMTMRATDNWWGTTDEEDIAARMEPQIDCCPPPDRAAVEWHPPAPVPQTPAEPPGPVGSPPREPFGHGDPVYIARVRRPNDFGCVPRGTLERIRGTVEGALGPTPERLHVALVRFSSTCRSYDPVKRRFGEPHACGRPRYFDVRVRDGRWHVRLHRPLRPGRYYFYAGDMPSSDEIAFRVLRG